MWICIWALAMVWDVGKVTDMQEGGANMNRLISANRRFCWKTLADQNCEKMTWTRVRCFVFTAVKLVSAHSPHENLVVSGRCRNQAEFFNSIRTLRTSSWGLAASSSCLLPAFILRCPLKRGKTNKRTFPLCIRLCGSGHYFWVFVLHQGDLDWRRYSKFVCAVLGGEVGRAIERK